MSLDASIGEKIRCQREAAGLALETLAQTLSLSTSEMGAIESGQQRIAAKILFGVAKALNLELQWFFDTVRQEKSSEDCADTLESQFKGEYPEILRNLRLNKTFADLCEAANEAKAMSTETKKVA